MKQYYADIYQQCKINQHLIYPLTTGSANANKIINVQQRLYQEVISSKVFNRK